MSARRSPVYVVGVDGGTSKTIALVADGAGRILGAGRSGNSNWSGPDVEKPMSVVVAAVREALQQAGVTGDRIAMAALCLAGADWPEDHTRREDYLRTTGIARDLVVKNDAFAGLRAGTRRPYGVVIAAGTGTNTAAIAPDGREWAFGYYATYGGGSDVGREAIEAMLRQDDGRGPETAITAPALEKLGYSSVEAMLRALVAHEVDRGRINSLCPLVFEAAYAGDAVAADIIEKQGRALAEYAVAIIRRFGMQDLEFDLVLSGGVFKGRGPLLVDTVAQVVHRVAPRARLVVLTVEPAVGAVLLAYDALGISVTEAMYAHLAQTCPGPELFDTSGAWPTLDDAARSGTLKQRR
ncbi:MAG: ATPase [Anaerolineae bacterium]|nr:ATPase [Anaerolineae bacterium]